VIERLIDDGFIGREAVGEFPVLALTARGRQAIRDTSLLPEWSTHVPAPDEEAEADPDLLAELKTWRTGKAREAGLPAYCILPNATLEALATVRPASTDALRRIKGIGDKTANAYGEELLALLT